MKSYTIKEIETMVENMMSHTNNLEDLRDHLMFEGDFPDYAK